MAEGNWLKISTPQVISSNSHVKCIQAQGEKVVGDKKWQKLKKELSSEK